MNQSYKTLYRSRHNRMIGGVAAGLGDYLGIDPTVVRLLFVLVAIVGWIAPAVIVYLVMMFVVPEEPLATVTSTRTASSEPYARETASSGSAIIEEASPAEQAPEQPGPSPE